MSFIAMVSLAVFAVILLALFKIQQKEAPLSRLVLIGLSLGSVFGLALQFFLG